MHHFDIPSRHSRLWIAADAVVDMAPAPVIPESLPASTWDELDAIAAAGQRWQSRQFSHFARDSALLGEFADELGWHRDADPLTLMRRLNYALFHTFTYAPSQHAGRFADRRCAEGARGRVPGPGAHHDCARPAHRHSVPIRQRLPFTQQGQQATDRLRARRTRGPKPTCPTLGWVGFDPTNDVLAAERHVRVAIGRDYADVPPTRGVFRGEARSELAVLVTVSLSDCADSF